MSTRTLVCSILLAFSALTACSVDDPHAHCQIDSDCDNGQECYLGFCVAADGGAMDASSEPPITGGNQNMPPTRRPDARVPDGRGPDQPSKPDARMPDMSEPDDAGTIEDDAGTVAGGGTQMPPASSCKEAMPCYGGARATMGVGVCKAGSQPCKDGKLGTCEGAVLPSPETCANEGADNDCNGKADDVPGRDEACTSSDPLAVCGDATRQCVKGNTNLTCVSPRMKTNETCNGRDDDCDGNTDENFDTQRDRAHCGACGTACSDGQSCCGGRCTATAGDNGCGSCGSAPSCQSGTTCCGGACLDLMNDERNCGGCGRTCDGGKTCCGGRCVDTRIDMAHCGGCGQACDDGSLPGCCGGRCVDLTSNDNCGTCGTVCGALGGLLCSCREEDGTARCRGTLLNLCI